MTQPNLSKGYLEGKKVMIANMWHRIEGINVEIAENVDEQTEVGLAYLKKDYDTAFSLLDKVTIRILTKLEKYSQTIPPLQLPENLVLNTNDKPNIKLKAMDIPVFTGDYDKWISFRNMFDSLVHKKKYTDLEKIHYLNEDEAERVISQYDISDESYLPAYDALVERFHNESILIDTHIVKILSQPKLNSESGDGLKEMMDVTTVNIQALKSLKVETDTWDFAAVASTEIGSSYETFMGAEFEAKGEVDHERIFGFPQ